MYLRSLLFSLVIALGVPSLAWSQAMEPPAAEEELRVSRPSPLVPLYLGLAAAQALDLHSTALAIDRGARERNPLLRALGEDNTWEAAAIKAGLTGATIWTAERMWKRHHRVQAVILMAAVTAFQAAVDAHNYRVAARLR
jgi:hypothetical protein